MCEVFQKLTQRRADGQRTLSDRNISPCKQDELKTGQELSEEMAKIGFPIYNKHYYHHVLTFDSKVSNLFMNESLNFVHFFYLLVNCRFHRQYLDLPSLMVGKFHKPTSIRMDLAP